MLTYLNSIVMAKRNTPKRYRKQKLELADKFVLPIPDDIHEVLDRRMIDINGVINMFKFAKRGRISKREIIIEALRRGLEQLYGGKQHLPTTKWNTFQYKYSARTKIHPYVALTEEADIETDEQD